VDRYLRPLKLIARICSIPGRFDTHLPTLDLSVDEHVRQHHAASGSLALGRADPIGMVGASEFAPQPVEIAQRHLRGDVKLFGY
jgi:hypothetical protein